MIININIHLLIWQIKTPAQVEAAFAFLTVTGSEDLDISKFEEACGVGIFKIYFLPYKYLLLTVNKDNNLIVYLATGVEVSTADIERTVDEMFEEKKSVILEQRYRTNGEFKFPNVY